MEVAISARAVAKSYGSKKALDDFSLEIFSGEIFGVIGPNGAGKTTFMRLLLDFIRPDSGELKIWGVSPREGGVQIRQNIGYLPGEVKLPAQQTGGELLKFWASAERDSKHSMQHALELSEYLELDLAQKVGALSKGNKQKLGIVQAFMGHPELLILDEPTSGLDPVVQQKFLELVTKANTAGATVFLSSHILQEIEQVATRAAVLRSGKLIKVDLVATLKSFAKQSVRVLINLSPEETGRNRDRSSGSVLNRNTLNPAQTEAEILTELRRLQFPLHLVRDGNSLELTGELSGDVNQLIALLAAYNVQHLVISEPDLTRSVMTMYEEGER